MQQAVNILPHDGEVYLFPKLFGPDESAVYFQNLLNEVPWQQQAIKIFGRSVDQPRLTCWYADDGKAYRYSGLTMEAHPWTGTLLEIKKRVEAVAGIYFNSALLNLYRHANDSVGWHRDNERELGEKPTIASVSLGSTRTFQLRSYRNKTERFALQLESGDVLLMRGETQANWEHQLPKMRKDTGARINVTFRIIS